MSPQVQAGKAVLQSPINALTGNVWVVSFRFLLPVSVGISSEITRISSHPFCVSSLVSLQVTKSNTNPDDLGGLANQLTNEFGDLAHEAKYASLTAENDEVGQFAHKAR